MRTINGPGEPVTVTVGLLGTGATCADELDELLDGGRIVNFSEIE